MESKVKQLLLTGKKNIQQQQLTDKTKLGQQENLVVEFDVQFKKYYTQINKLLEQRQEEQRIHMQHKIEQLKNLLILQEKDLRRGFQTQLLASINQTVSAKLKEYESHNNVQSQLKQVLIKQQQQMRELKATLRTDLIRETQDLIKAQIKQFKLTYTSKKKMKGTTTLQQQMINHIEQNSTNIQQLLYNTKRNSEILENLQKSTYDKFDEIKTELKLNQQLIKDYKQYNSKITEGLRKELFQLRNIKSLDNNNGSDSKKIHQNIDDVIHHIYCNIDKINQNIGQFMTRYEFEKLYYNNIDLNLKSISSQIVVLQHQSMKNNENQKYTINLTEGFDKFQEHLDQTLLKMRQSFKNNKSEETNFILNLEQSLNSYQSESNRRMDTITSQLKNIQSNQSSEIYSIEQHFNKQILLIKQQLQNLKQTKQKELEQQATIQKYYLNKTTSENNQKIEAIQFSFIESLKKINNEIENLKNNQLIKEELQELWTATRLLDSKFYLLKHESDQIVHFNKKSLVSMDINPQMNNDSDFLRVKRMSQEKLSTHKNQFQKTGGFVSSTQLKHQKQKKLQVLGGNITKLPEILLQKP